MDTEIYRKFEALFGKVYSKKLLYMTTKDTKFYINLEALSDTKVNIIRHKNIESRIIKIIQFL
jgi:hypothetical protein